MEAVNLAGGIGAQCVPGRHGQRVDSTGIQAIRRVDGVLPDRNSAVLVRKADQPEVGTGPSPAAAIDAVDCQVQTLPNAALVEVRSAGGFSSPNRVGRAVQN